MPTFNDALAKPTATAAATAGTAAITATLNFCSTGLFFPELL